MRYRYLIGLAFAVGLTAVAAVLTFAVGPAPAEFHERFVDLLPGPIRARARLVFTAALATVGIVYLADRLNMTALAPVTQTDQPPEEPRTPPRVIGEQFAATIDEAVTTISRGAEQDSAQTDPQQRLRELVIATTRLREGCQRSTARDRVESGKWTDDRVAQAFLSDKIEPPPRQQLIRWGRADVAYERAVERTVNAVDQFVTGTDQPAQAQTEALRGGEQPETVAGWTGQPAPTADITDDEPAAVSRSGESQPAPAEPDG